MGWQIIKAAEINNWNEKLKQTDASFYQYPYFLSAQYSSIFSKTVYIKYINEHREIAFAAIVELGAYPFKVGIIESGPVILEKEYDKAEILSELKRFARKKRYMHLQIRPPVEIDSLLKNDTDFYSQIFFPFHQKEEFELNIYNQPEEKLLASFKMQGRRKIVLAGRVPFGYKKLEDKSELSEVEKLFSDVTKVKGYQYTPFNIFRKIYENGKKHELCDIYIATLNNKIVNAVIVVKDAQSFYHLISALIVKGYKDSESPPAKLHFFIMQDCFYNQQKEYYNISYGGSDNLVRFKELFNPIIIKKPPYYTYIINKGAFLIFKKITPESTTRVRGMIRKVSKLLHA